MAHFIGTSLTAQLGTPAARQIFKAVVDGTPQPAFTAAGGTVDRTRWPPASTAGVHTVELYRQTEGAQGESQLMGLTVGGGALMDPPGRAGPADRGHR